MWQLNEIEKSPAGSPNNWEQPWPCTETLKTLAELNEQCLELLGATKVAHQVFTNAWYIVPVAMTIEAQYVKRNAVRKFSRR